MHEYPIGRGVAGPAPAPRLASFPGAARATRAGTTARPARRTPAHETVRTLSRALELTADGVFITDRHGTIEYVNPAFETLMGCPRADLVGRQPRVFKSGEHGEAFYRRLWTTLLEGNVFRGVFVDRRADGSLVHLDETITPLRGPDGEITHFVAAARDITERVHTEELLRRLNENLEQQTRRMAQVLHDEAGSLLTGAYIALSDAARELPQAASTRLAGVRVHLDRIEERLRCLAHEFRPIILDDLGLAAAIAFLARGVEKRWNLPVAVDAAGLPDLPDVAQTVLYRVVQEALANICRHARARRVTIRVRRAEHEVRCSISDDGVGFDVAALEAPGTPGLGLKGLRDRLQALGGTLRIRSRCGRGTCLRAAIPSET